MTISAMGLNSAACAGLELVGVRTESPNIPLAAQLHCRKTSNSLSMPSVGAKWYRTRENVPGIESTDVNTSVSFAIQANISVSFGTACRDLTG